ncbi:MAG: heat-inducible transcriptional repressor HrcA [Peptococcales bacterium]|jgi:heat-inducible transcriptional repressor
MELDARKRKVLEAIIIDYIATAEPVGSRTISRKYKLGVSPATIRNEMADLEEMGLIEQPHTSAGRVPSDAGYRYYVDCIMERQDLENEAKMVIKNSFQKKIKQLEELIQLSLKMLSSMTSYTSLILAPQVGSSTLQLIQMILVEPGKALIVVITDGGRIENRIIDIPEEVTKNDLEIVSTYLNNRFKGLTSKDWDKTILRAVHSELLKQKNIVSIALDFLDSLLNEEIDDKVYLAGALNILNQPEFKDVSKVKNLLELLENEDTVSSILKDDSEGIHIKIGAENKYESIKDCSLITATYKMDGRILGTIGLLGPTRMQYAQAISILEFLTDTLSLSLKRF